MKNKQWIALSCAALLVAGTLAGCSSGKEDKPVDAANKKSTEDNSPFEISIAGEQVGEIPKKGNEVEQAIEKYTNTKLNIQWIPLSAYNDKVNVMIASNELPKLLKARVTPTITKAIETGLFWEIGPLLKDYKNLSAQNPLHFDNLAVNGKKYGVPIFRDIGRAGIIYRKDWLDALGMKLPTNMEQWYEVLKAMTLNDPDKNGKNDTFGIVLYKNYSEGPNNLFTRLAVNQGAPNKWGVDNGKFTPDFTTKEYNDVLIMFRKLFAEKLINQDFAVFDEEESRKLLDSGRAGFMINVAKNGKAMQERISKNNPNAVLDVEPMVGPKGIRVAGEPGNAGFYLIPKSAVRTEAELKKVLTFLDRLMEPQMSTLLLRGIEGKHYVKTADNRTEYKDFALYQREIKPYNDNFISFEGYNVAPLKDSPIGEKGFTIEKENMKYAVPNPALTLTSVTYTERGRELEQMIQDAQTKFIMGKIDEAGWQAEVDKWRKAGGDKLIKEYEDSYAKTAAMK
ncbi:MULTISPECIES: extracellular solute-binding protein [unclassified Paenibacillus]|uniref:extracellular solute-binding protein n=1 Tax=unclassified Paenibacillus TaxID=185978 RepID=UPI003644EBBC